MKLGIIGDFIIDEYLYYESKRLSPESPCPVVNFIKSRKVAGGAANVANSCAAIGLDLSFIYCKPLDSKNYRDLLYDFPTFSYSKSKFFFSYKKRHCVDNKQFFREDKEILSSKFKDDFHNIDKILNYLIQSKIKYLLISDYQKGALTPNEIKYLLRKCSNNNIRTFIDTKIKSKEYLENIFLFKPNLKEFEDLTGYKSKSSTHEELVNELEPFAEKLMSSNNIANCVVTLSELGSVWYCLNKKKVSYSPPQITVTDIVGAGDSFLSALVYTFLTDENYSKAQKLRIANYFSEITIKEQGTNPISTTSLNKILKEVKIAEIGFTNGCFDILHPGHISLLKQAKEKCKYLIVGLNSDASIKRLKGINRPVNSEIDRKNVLENIQWVDKVIIFEEDTPLNLIKKIKPNLLIKGSDYNIKDVVGADFVKDNGGEVFLANLLKTKSTTERVEDIKR